MCTKNNKETHNLELIVSKLEQDFIKRHKSKDPPGSRFVSEWLGQDNKHKQVDTYVK